MDKFISSMKMKNELTKQAMIVSNNIDNSRRKIHNMVNIINKLL